VITLPLDEEVITMSVSEWSVAATAALTAFGIALRYIVPALIVERAIKNGRDVDVHSGLKGLRVKTRAGKTPVEENRIHKRVA
jgi:hypothetical protein